MRYQLSLERPVIRQPHLERRLEESIPLITMELGHLGGCYVKRRQAYSSEAYPFITSRFIHINKMIGTKLRNKIKVLIPQLWNLLSCLPFAVFFDQPSCLRVVFRTTPENPNPTPPQPQMGWGLGYDS
jgi:hypothetical protein